MAVSNLAVSRDTILKVDAAWRQRQDRRPAAFASYEEYFRAMEEGFPVTDEARRNAEGRQSEINRMSGLELNAEYRRLKSEIQAAEFETVAMSPFKPRPPDDNTCNRLMAFASHVGDVDED